MTAVAFFARGIPVPQGSPTAFARPGGRAIVVSGATGRGTHGRRLADWRQVVAIAARDAMGQRPVLTGPVEVELDFRMPRPKSHFRADGPLKPNAPTWVTTRPDGDKLERAAWDSLTGVVVSDDAVIASWAGSKAYPDEDGVTGVWVRVTELAR